MEVVVTTGAISCAKLQSNHHHQQTNIQLLQTGCPSCRPTNNVKALKGKYHIPWTCLPQAHRGNSLSVRQFRYIQFGWCYFPSETDGNKWPQFAIFRLAQMVPPIECDLGYRFPTRTLNPNSNLNPNPKTNPNPDPKSNKNLCSAKRHTNKVQNSVISTSYFVGQGVGA